MIYVIILGLVLIWLLYHVMSNMREKSNEYYDKMYIIRTAANKAETIKEINNIWDNMVLTYNTFAFHKSHENIANVIRTILITKMNYINKLHNEKNRN